MKEKIVRFDKKKFEKSELQKKDKVKRKIINVENYKT